MEPERIREIIKENSRRRKNRDSYNPLTGQGCYGKRFRLQIREIGTLYLPEELKSHPDIQTLIKTKSIRKMAGANGDDAREEEYGKALIDFAELRMNFDFEYFAIAAETITDKQTSQLTPFILNRGQRKLLAVFEDMRRSHTPIRVILLKARQWGGSTLTQLYMFWIQIRLRTGWNSVICAHTMDAAKNIRAMYKLCVAHMTAADGLRHQLLPFEGAINIKHVPRRNCRITVGSAVEPESIRSQDIKMAHFSEVALYPKTENTSAKQLVTSVISSIPAIPDTVIVYESTAHGVGDFFHAEYTKAAAGLSPFRPVFVSWFEIGDLYSADFDGRHYNHSGLKTNGGTREFIADMDDCEINLFRNNPDITLEHLNWRRFKKSEIGDDLPQEYPSDHIEAFKNSGENVFNQNHIEALRDGCNRNPLAVGILAADAEPASAKITGTPKKNILRNVRFIHDDDALQNFIHTHDPNLKEKKLNAKLVIWKFPDTDTPCLRRYIVVYDPQRGVTDKADWGVITVLDRYWRIFGGKSEIVAEWRAHTDKDIAIWIAVQIATFYNNALFVVESNTFDSDYKKEDGAEFIFETIAHHYRNLYHRTEADKLRQGLPIRYGFHTNRNTKPAIIADFVATLRERAYIERSHRTLDQARVYERKKDGSYGAKDGHHDDDLITRMIALFIDYHEYPLPQLLTHTTASNAPAITRTTDETSI
jgi:hypothetical protein